MFLINICPYVFSASQVVSALIGFQIVPSVSFSEAQPFYIGVPVSHRRKRRRHRSYASDADRRTHYDYHTRCEHSHRGYCLDREEHCDDEQSTDHHEHTDPTG